MMRAGKAVSEESLQRLWSEIALLRQEIEQAQRDRAASQVQLGALLKSGKPGFTKGLSIGTEP